MDVVIIGAGQAGAALAAKLRALGHQGAITLIGEETSPPYQRPPLSKGYLLGDMPAERLWLRSPQFWEDQNITLKLGQKVTAIDRVQKTVHLNGETLPYDALALTTGSSPRSLPASIGGALPGVYGVRNLADVDMMRAEFQPGRRVVIVGGGYVGLEAAAVAAKLGLTVTVVELAPRILNRVAAPQTADYFRTLHQSHGVTLLEATGLAEILGDDRATGVRLTDGRILAADFVIAGVGIMPNIDLAQAAGLAIDDGIATDAQGLSSDPAIWAAGDCASFPYRDGRIRLESVGNAIDQAEVVAANMLGAAQAYAAKPWFWSDQFDCKLQIAGLNTGYDKVVARENGASASYWYYKGPTLLAIDAMNDPRAYMVGKRLIEAGKTADPALVADLATDLKVLMK